MVLVANEAQLFTENSANDLETIESRMKMMAADVFGPNASTSGSVGSNLPKENGGHLFYIPDSAPGPSGSAPGASSFINKPRYRTNSRDGFLEIVQKLVDSTEKMSAHIWNHRTGTYGTATYDGNLSRDKHVKQSTLEPGESISKTTLCQMLEELHTPNSKPDLPNNRGM